MPYSSISTGRFTTGELDRIELPRILIYKTPIIMMGGGSYTAWTALVDGAETICAGLVEVGFAVYIPTVSSMFGNDASVIRENDALTYARANGAHPTAPPVILGLSNGSVCGFRWVRENPASAMIAILPALDLQEVYETNTFLAQDDIGTAWGIALDGSGILPDKASPINSALNGYYADVPTQLHYASDDALSTIYSGVGTAIDAFSTAVPEADIHNLGALGHSAAAIQAVNIDSLVEFVVSNVEI